VFDAAQVGLYEDARPSVAYTIQVIQAFERRRLAVLAAAYAERDGSAAL
jgi:hypothetical protein